VSQPRLSVRETRSFISPSFGCASAFIMRTPRRGFYDDWREWVRLSQTKTDSEWKERGVVKCVYYRVMPLNGGNVKTFTGLVAEEFLL